MKIFVFLLAFFLSLNSSTYSQILRYSNDFLTIGTSAKNISVGNSVVATVADYSAGYYNPAGLSYLSEKHQASIMHAEYFSGIAKYDFAGFAYKISDSMGLAFSLVRLGIDNIQNTLYIYDENGNVDYDKIELFSVADYAILLSLGKKTKIKGLSYGTSMKIIYRNVGKFANAWGFGFDLGIKYSVKNWNIGANLANATSLFTAWLYNLDPEVIDIFEKTGNIIPKNSLEITMPILNTGISRYFKFSDKFGMEYELDINFTFDGKRNAIVSFNPVSLYPHTGTEINYKRLIFVRMGVNNLQIIPDFKNNKNNNYFAKKRLNLVPSIGIGIKYRGLELDYAYTDIANTSISLYSNIFSISYKF